MSSAGPGSDARTAPESAERELLVRHAQKDGRPVATLRAFDHGDGCVVEADVYPASAADSGPIRRGPYAFEDAHAATAFVVEATEALMYLGCTIA